MDSLGYPIMPNFGAEATDNTLGSTSAANAYTTDTNTQSHNTNDAINNIEFSARGTSDISVILDQLMTITDQVMWFDICRRPYSCKINLQSFIFVVYDFDFSYFLVLG